MDGADISRSGRHYAMISPRFSVCGLAQDIQGAQLNDATVRFVIAEHMEVWRLYREGPDIDPFRERADSGPPR